MSPAEPLDRAAALLSRLLADSEFRARFRRDPAAACRAHDLPDLADELAAAEGMRTLDQRESKSSLAGVVMAVAFEGVTAYQLVERLGPGMAADAAAALDRALTLSHLDAVKGALAADAPAAAAPAPPPQPAEEAGPVPGMEAAIEPDAEGEADGEAGDGKDRGGGRGGGGASVESLLKNPNLDLPAGARADLEAGEVDPRLVAVLGRLTDDHEIGLSVIKTGHGKFTSSGFVSNHFHGRGIDISSVDGQPVSPGNVGAREVSTLLAELKGQLRPTEIGTPFPISAPGFFTDGAHQDHIHVAFDSEAPEGLELPSGEPARGRGEGGERARAGGEAPGAFAPAEGKQGSKRHSARFLPAVEAGEEEGAELAEVRPGSGFDLDAAAADYPGDDAGRAELARWLARHARAAGLPGELPVMAALVESDVQNLGHGHADSVGFFQMRVGIWNKGEYAGYSDRPELQLKWFIDHARAVKKQQGISGADPSVWGEWIADVERPAEQYRGRYQLQLGAARALLRR